MVLKVKENSNVSFHVKRWFSVQRVELKELKFHVN